MGHPDQSGELMQMIRCLVATLLILAAGAAGAAQWQGQVFDDRDGDGIAGAGESGIAGVIVSDGRSLARTDGEGRYRLDAQDGAPVFVVKPAGWRMPLRADGLPAAWRAPQPGPGLRQGDFALLRDTGTDAETLSVLLFADPQVKSVADVDYYARDIVAPLLAGDAHGADFGISLGDIVDDVVDLYPAINAVTTRLGLPWLHVPGNHDIDPDAQGDDASLSAFRASSG